MPSAVKTEAEQERQKLFEALRHYFGSKHQVPDELDSADLHAMTTIISGKRYEFY